MGISPIGSCVSSTDLASLLQRVARGDRLAFRALYDATAPKLFAIALRISRDRAGAEEIVQEVFLRVWRKADTYVPEQGSALAWLATITRYRAIDVVRSRGAEPLASPSAAEEDVSGWLDRLAVAAPGADPADARALRQCLERVDGPTREALVLAYCEGYSREELAERFGANVNTIKTWLRRGLLGLRQCLEGEAA